MASEGTSWSELLKQYKVSDLLDEDVFVLRQVEPTATIPEVLQVLTDNKISSVPVYNSSKQLYEGLVDILDLATVAVTLGSSKDLVDLAAHHTVPLADFFAQADYVFSVQSVGVLCNASERNEWRPVRTDASVEELLHLLGDPCHLHRVAVVDGDSFMRGILTQSEVVAWLASLLPLLRASVLETKVSSTGIGSPVISVTEDSQALAAFRQLIDAKISGLAVVNGSGQLVACISGSDLKRPAPHRIFQDLTKTVQEFLAITPEAFAHSSAAITLPAEATIGDLLKLLKESHVHRLFQTDADGRPTTVISLTDVLSWFSRHA